MYKIHCGTIFNKGDGLCGLSEFKYEHSWNSDHVTCLNCLKVLVTYDIPPNHKKQVKKQIIQLKHIKHYNEDFDKLLK